MKNTMKGAFNTLLLMNNGGYTKQRGIPLKLKSENMTQHTYYYMSFLNLYNLIFYSILFVETSVN